MDRTMMAPYKAEEKELNDILLKKLNCLTKVHAASEDLRKCLTEDLFLKPNHAAFFQIFHYLFVLLDVAEFKKRFFWPVTDKRAEGNFRTATVEYLKYLNEKHNLKWTNIASYLLVKPCGMKFINCMLQIVTFVLAEVTKQRERQLAAEFKDLSELCALHPLQLREANGFLKEYSAAYVSDCDELIEEFGKKSKNLIKELEQALQGTNCSIDMLLNGNMLSSFEASNQALYERNILKPMQCIELLNAALAEAKGITQNFSARDGTRHNKINKEAVQLALQNMRDAEDDADANAGAAVNKDFSMNTLISAFNKIHSKLTNALQMANATNPADENALEQLSDMKALFDQLETKMSNYQKSLKARIEKFAQLPNNSANESSEEDTPTNSSTILQWRKFDELNLMEKYVSTPTIKLDMLDMASNTRLPLLEKNNLSETLSILRSAKKIKMPTTQRKKCFDANATMNGSKIIDPMELLRTIHKNTEKTLKPYAAIDQSNWHERQLTFGMDIGLEVPHNWLSNSNNEKTFCQSIEKAGIQSSSLLEASNSNNNLMLPPKKLGAVKKLQNASLNLHNLSTSPSGRLEPLFMDEKDISLVLPKESNKVKNHIDIKQQEDLAQNDNVNDMLSSHMIALQLNEDDIFNTSDSVLKNITM